MMKLYQQGIWNFNESQRAPNELYLTQCCFVDFGNLNKAEIK